VKIPVQNKWISSGKLVGEAKIAVTWYLFDRRAEKRGAWPCPSNLSERF
jgi:hypothetical protein